jgi:hypothetical protein
MVGSLLSWWMKFWLDDRFGDSGQKWGGKEIGKTKLE